MTQREGGGTNLQVTLDQEGVGELVQSGRATLALQVYLFLIHHVSTAATHSE